MLTTISEPTISEAIISEAIISENRPPVPLDPDSAERLRLSDDVTAAVDGFLDGLGEAPTNYGQTDPGLIGELLQPPPEHGTSDISGLLDTILTGARTGFDTAAGGQLSYIPNGGLYTGALGRFVAAALNRWTGAAFAQPGAVALEQSVVDWMLELFGLGPSAAGVLLSGGSMATFGAVVAARNRLGDEFDNAVIYTSERAHHSVAKAARLAGVRSSGVRTIATDRQQRLNPAALEQAITADRSAGMRPMMIVATAGTTDTGSIDPLPACADIAADNDVWFHVDAAYGGFFTLTTRGRRLLSGIERADSITVDAHKSLLIPYGVGGLLVADSASLVDANEGRGAYMQDASTPDGILDFCTLGPELSRPYRGLDVWLPLHLHGVAAFRAELDRMLDLARRAALRLQATSGIELVTEPTLSIVTFRCVSGNAATRHVLDRLNRSGDVHVSSTTIGDQLVLRLAFLNHRTGIEVADRAVDLVAQATSCLSTSYSTSYSASCDYSTSAAA